MNLKDYAQDVEKSIDNLSNQYYNQSMERR